MPKINSSNASENPFFKELIRLNQTIEKLTVQNQNIQDRLDEAMRSIEEKDKIILNLSEQVSNLSTMLFGQSSEKSNSKKGRSKKGKDEKKDSESEDDPDSSDDDPVGKPISLSKTRKAKNNKKSASDKTKEETIKAQMERLGIVPEEIIEYLPDEERFCLACGAELVPVGAVHMGYEFHYVPAKLTVIDRKVMTYSCSQCKKEANKKTADYEKLNLAPVRAKAKRPLLHKSWATASLMAAIITFKIQHQIPVNRLRNIWKDFGNITPSVTTLYRWIIETSKRYFQPLYTKLKSFLITRKALCADETTLQVINEPVARRKSKSFMWQFRSVEDDPLPIVLFLYTQGRHGKNAADFLEGFDGILLADGYSGYNKVECQGLAGCWAHARRKFIIASLCSRSSFVRSLAAKALVWIDSIFDIEDEVKDEESSLQERYQKRQKESLPLVNELFDWARSVDLGSIVSEKMRQAVNYLLNHEVQLKVFLSDPMIPATNNRCEQSFVSFSRGRHNWLFAYGTDGARALEVLFSIVKTAEANHLNVPGYLEYVMTTFKEHEEGQIPEAVINSVLPWREEIRLAYGIK